MPWSSTTRPASCSSAATPGACWSSRTAPPPEAVGCRRERRTLAADPADRGRRHPPRRRDHHFVVPAQGLPSFMGFIPGSDVIRWKRGLILLLVALGCLFFGVRQARNGHTRTP